MQTIINYIPIFGVIMLKSISYLFGVSFFMLVGMISCDEAPQQMELSDLVGKWEDGSQSNKFIEEWSLNDEKEMSGKGYVMSSHDTVFIEYLSIREVNGVLTYFAQVSDHNDGQVIPFGLKENKNFKMVFENIHHDFPQRIIYELTTDTTLYVYIEGHENGNFRRRKLSFLKKDLK